MNRDERRAWAERIIEARNNGQTISPITDSHALTLADAYVIQDLVTAGRIAAGEQVIGWKLGYTSAAMREQMGIDRPNFGPLTEAMIVEDGQRVPFPLVQPRVEPEIAIRICRTVPEGVLASEVEEFIDVVRVCLEIVDPVWHDYRFRIEDNTADGSSAAGLVLGPRLDSAEGIGSLRDLPVVLRQNGREVGSGTVQDALGGPDHAVAWLSAILGQRGRTLNSGDIVITGGLTPAMPLESDTVIESIIGRSTRVSVRGAVIDLG